MPLNDIAYLARNTSQLPWPQSSEAGHAGSMAGAAEKSSRTIDDFFAGEPADAGAAALAPTISHGLKTVVRTLKDAHEACKAHAEIPKLWASSIDRLSEGRPALDMGPAHAMAMLTDVKLRNSMHALGAMAEALHEDARPVVARGLKSSREAFATAFRAPTLGNSFAAAAAPAASAEPNSDSMHAFFGDISHAIDSLKTNYLGVYEEAMQKNSAFYKEFLEATDLSKWMTTTDKNVTLTLTENGPMKPSKAWLKKEAAKLKAWADKGEGDPKWKGMSEFAIEQQLIAEGVSVGSGSKKSGLLGKLYVLLQEFAPFSADNEGSGVLVFAANEETARKWAKDMGLPDTAVQENLKVPEGNPQRWAVTLDLKPVKNIVSTLETMIKDGKTKTDADGKVTVTLATAEFQAWKVGYEAQATEIKNIATVMAQKMANAQSIYENLIKILSNTINSIMDMLKNFL